MPLPDLFRSAAARGAVALMLALGAVAPAVADTYEDFVFAVTNDRVPLVKELLAKGVDPNSVDPAGEPMLVVAARFGFKGTVDALLAGKANVNAKSAVGDTAIMAAALNGHLDVVQTLRAKGAALDGPGWTPLLYAATGGHDAVVTYLLAEGANVNAPSPNGTTALMMAVREGKPATARLLLAKGADVNARNQNGATALAWAKRGNEKELAAQLEKAGAKE
jgi:hypothetical protein